MSDPIGPTEAATLAAIDRCEFGGSKIGEALAASALALARRMDLEPTAAVARELRLMLVALDAQSRSESELELERFLSELSRSPLEDQ